MAHPINTTGKTTDPRPELHPTSLGMIGASQEGPEDAPALICIHGIPGSTRDFRYLAPLLTSRFRVIRVDMPGFGSSPASSIRTIEAWSQIPGALATRLGLDGYYLLGHSFGGGVAIRAATRDRERVLGLVLLASMGGRVHRGFGLPPLAYRIVSHALEIPLLRIPLAAWAFRGYETRKLPKPGDRQQLALQLRIIGSLNFEEQRRLASALPMPVHSFHCRNDRLVEAEIARDLAGDIPDCDLTLFEGGGHHLQKTRAEQIARTLIQSLDSPIPVDCDHA